MKILVTGSSGHLGEALVRTLQSTNHEVVAMDHRPSEFTNALGSIVNRDFVRRFISGVDAVLHTATLHKPHLYTHTQQDFIDTNITGTLNLLEEAAVAGVSSFIFTSTTSTFGYALAPSAGLPAAWITEDVRPAPKNIYGVSKIAAEDLCELFYCERRLPCIVLRTSRFFPEEDDREEIRKAYEDGNVKTNEFLYRRVDVEDVVSAHLLAVAKAASIGFGRYIISATTPFTPEDLVALRTNAPGVVKQKIPEYEEVYTQRGWKMFPGIDRVYVNWKAQRDLGWFPKYDFFYRINRLRNGDDPRSPISCVVGSKAYNPTYFETR